MKPAQVPFPGAEEFIFWLSLVDPTAIIAKDWRWTDCPLCEYLREVGYQNPVVWGTGTYTTDYYPSRPLPDWAFRFITIVDAKEPKLITAGDCLSVMENILTEASAQ